MEVQAPQPPSTGARRKRKAESQDNERLSKRLSLLNLERNGQKLYVPVEQPASSPTTTKSQSKSHTRAQEMDDSMQLDDTKHKVYIYDLDAELSDSDTSDDGRLVFLPNIQKHLRETRIPPMVFANSDGELAGMDKQMVLYSVPSSLTVPEEQDSVRKAIIETRARARAKQEEREREKVIRSLGIESEGASVWGNGGEGGAIGVPFVASGALSDVSMISNQTMAVEEEEDPDAMDLG